MRTPQLSSFALALSGGLLAGPASAAGLDIRIQIPQLDVAEYHRPYVAVWVEREDRSVAANLSVWYQQKRAAAPAAAAPAAGAPPQGNEGGTKWLPDLRQWWRRGGRELSLPVDGLSGATRPVGEHDLQFGDGKTPLPALPAGKYKLMVEAAREEGGRELVEIPFEWPAKAGTPLKAQGKSELGAVSLVVKS
ncbi:MAG: DUF2271 domain-containing protein [Stagnimonas sp.]|nr:DUF2271 domain-containing protein [Stagnimonas sp.]